MRRITAIIGIVASLLAVGVLCLPLFLSSDLVRGRILDHLTSLTGASVSFRGTPSVSFSPFLGIEIADLTVIDPHSDDPATPLLRVESIKAKLDLLPAIIGNIEISKYQLIRPELKLIQRTDGKSSWNFTSGTLKAALDASREDSESNSSTRSATPKLGEFDIIGGTIRFTSEGAESGHEIASINGQLNWSDTDDQMVIFADAIWRNEMVKVQTFIEEPIKIFAGGESEITSNLISDPLSFDFTGKANMFSNLFVEGDIDAQTPSINRLAEFLRIDLGTLRTLGAWSANGRLNATLETTLLSDATLTINNRTATGVVRIANRETGGQKLDGTLAFDEISLVEYISQGEPGTATITEATPGDLDIDLRISANEIDAGRFTLGNVAAAITSNEKGWQFDIGNSEAFGGTLVAQIGTENLETGTQLSLKFNTKNSDASELESIIGTQEWTIDGTVDLKGDLRTQLSSETLSNLRFSGELEAGSKEGTINGIDLIKAFKSIQDGRSGVIRGDALSGDTEYETLELKVFLGNNIASISKASILSEKTQIQLLGDADLSKGTLAIRAQRLSEGSPIPGRLMIGGTLNDPLVTIGSTPEPKDVHPEPTNEIKTTGDNEAG